MSAEPAPEQGEFRPKDGKTTARLPIPRLGPYEEYADGEGFRFASRQGIRHVRRICLPKDDDGSEADTACTSRPSADCARRPNRQSDAGTLKGRGQPGPWT